MCQWHGFLKTLAKTPTSVNERSVVSPAFSIEMQDVATAGRPICESRFFDIRSTQLQSDQTDLPVTKKGNGNCVARLLGMLRLDRVDHTVLVLDRH